MQEPDVSAISVVDLARQLKRYAIIGNTELTRLNKQLAENVHKLETGEDISFLAEVRYPESWLVQLWNHADRNTRVPDIGVRIATTISPEAHGLLAHLMLYSNTLESALSTYLEKISLVNASERWDVENHDNKVTLSLHFSSRQAYPHCAIERSLLSVPSMGQYLCGRKIPLEKVEFSFPKPGYAQHLKKQLGCTVRFSSDRNILVLDNEILAWPLPNRNNYMRTTLEKRVNDLGFTHTDKTLIQKIQKLWEENFVFYSRVGNISRRLHMSRSTLYRKLNKENTSFSELLDKQRQKILDKNPAISANQAYERLGFHDIGAYYKARKRWKNK